MLSSLFRKKKNKEVLEVIEVKEEESKLSFKEFEDLVDEEILAIQDAIKTYIPLFELHGLYETFQKNYMAISRIYNQQTEQSEKAEELKKQLCSLFGIANRTDLFHTEQRQTVEFTIGVFKINLQKEYGHITHKISLVHEEKELEIALGTSRPEPSIDYQYLYERYQITNSTKEIDVQEFLKEKDIIEYYKSFLFTSYIRWTSNIEEPWMKGLQKEIQHTTECLKEIEEKSTLLHEEIKEKRKQRELEEKRKREEEKQNAEHYFRDYFKEQSS